VLAIERDGASWCARLTGGRTARAARLVVCPGGRSYTRTGTTGDGYAWLAGLGLRIVPPVPALVPLCSPEAWVRELAGIALQETEARLLDQSGRELGRRARPVLFTHEGLSGPGAMDLSEPVARAEAGRGAGEPRPSFSLSLDLCPGVPREELRLRLQGAARRRGNPLASRALALGIPRRLLQAAPRQAGFAGAEPRVNALDRERSHRLVEAVKGLRVPIVGTLGWDRAEVTAGGLELGALDAGTMRVKGFDGLYACGEILDLQGPIGGLNFQSAFATAELAALDAARR
jgi:hypothetical protein